MHVIRCLVRHQDPWIVVLLDTEEVRVSECKTVFSLKGGVSLFIGGKMDSSILDWVV